MCLRCVFGQDRQNTVAQRAQVLALLALLALVEHPEACAYRSFTLLRRPCTFRIWLLLPGLNGEQQAMPSNRSQGDQ